MAKDGGAYLGNNGFRKIHLANRDALTDLLDDIVEAGDISNAVMNDILLADAVHTAIRKADGAPVYILTEVASRIHVDDIERSTRRAASLQEATGRDSVPCVVGASIDDPAEALATQRGCVVVLPSDWKVPASQQ